MRHNRQAASTGASENDAGEYFSDHLWLPQADKDPAQQLSKSDEKQKEKKY